MQKIKCKKCGKEILGYTKNHAEYLMMQHELKHKREDKEKQNV